MRQYGGRSVWVHLPPGYDADRSAAYPLLLLHDGQNLATSRPEAWGGSWRVDETYVAIRGKWHYLYRAVDKRGRTVDSLLRPDRSIAAAQPFFRKALASTLPRVPRKVTIDGHVPSRHALWLLRREHPCWRRPPAFE